MGVKSHVIYDHMIGTNSTKQDRKARAQALKTQTVSPGNKMVNANEKQKYKNSEKNRYGFVSYWNSQRGN